LNQSLEILKDITKIALQCSNRTIAQRTSTNQETMCEVAKLSMVVCSESIETISLLAAKRFTDRNERKSSFVTK
jgi:hypothetical protein